MQLSVLAGSAAGTKDTSPPQHADVGSFLSGKEWSRVISSILDIPSNPAYVCGTMLESESHLSQVTHEETLRSDGSGRSISVDVFGAMSS